jgi:hypothetical protein
MSWFNINLSGILFCLPRQRLDLIVRCTVLSSVSEGACSSLLFFLRGLANFLYVCFSLLTVVGVLHHFTVMRWNGGLSRQLRVGVFRMGEYFIYKTFPEAWKMSAVPARAFFSALDFVRLYVLIETDRGHCIKRCMIFRIVFF